MRSAFVELPHFGDKAEEFGNWVSSRVHNSECAVLGRRCSFSLIIVSQKE